MTRGCAGLKVAMRAAQVTDAALIAGLHGESFPDEPWDEESLARILATPGTLGLLAVAPAGTWGAEDVVPLGFALARVAADEAEVLAIGVRPAYRGGGVGGRLIDDLMAAVRLSGAARLYLEVAADNAPARALYGSRGFRDVGRRDRYYRRAAGGRADAVIACRAL